MRAELAKPYLEILGRWYLANRPSSHDQTREVENADDAVLVRDVRTSRTRCAERRHRPDRDNVEMSAVAIFSRL
jgi:hypothetical protein